MVKVFCRVRHDNLILHSTLKEPHPFPMVFLGLLPSRGNGILRMDGDERPIELLAVTLIIFPTTFSLIFKQFSEGVKFLSCPPHNTWYCVNSP